MEDFKNSGVETTTESGQADNKPESLGGETLKTQDDLKFVPKEEYEKVVRDRDNYKEGMLKAKKQLEDVKPKAEVVTPTAGYNPEKEAIMQFEAKHGVSIDKVVKYYVPNHGKDTITGILVDLEEALEYFKWKENKQTSNGTNSQGAGVSETEQKQESNIQLSELEKSILTRRGLTEKDLNK